MIQNSFDVITINDGRDEFVLAAARGFFKINVEHSPKKLSPAKSMTPSSFLGGGDFRDVISSTRLLLRSARAWHH